jgi:hypothetical protein
MIGDKAAAAATRKPIISVMSMAFRALYSVLSIPMSFPLTVKPVGDISSNLLRSRFILYNAIPVNIARANHTRAITDQKITRPMITNISQTKDRR